MLGKILGGRYELLEKIGGGGMAIVYKAKCHLLKRFVAVKVLRPELVEDEEFVSRFGRESQSAASLSHPNIVNIYDVGEEDGIHYIVMEYVKGKTLKEYIRERGRLEPEEAIKIALQICSALKHAHKNKIVHRDIKPQNILVSEDGTIKVADFGIARAVSSSTVTIAGANVIGSVHYFSPEQARGGYVDTQSDLYSLGIVLYEMVTGTVPFEGDSAISVALKHIQEEVKPPGEINPDVPQSLQDIIQKSTQKSQDRRYQSAEEMIRDLQKALREPELGLNLRDNGSDTPTRVMKPVKPEEEEQIPKRSKQQKPKKRRAWLEVLLITVPSILLVFLLVYFGVQIYKNNFVSQEVEVPPLVGMSENEARVLLYKSNLNLKIHGSTYSQDYEQGEIISQTPQPGMHVKVDSPIEVVVSLGPKTITVPNYVGENIKDAEFALENLGLTMGEIQYEASNYPNGIVIAQSIPAESEVVDDAEIILTVSKGPEITTVEVGKYEGLSEEMARKAIVDDQLAVGKIVREPNDSVVEGYVIRQDPPPGDTVDLNREIDLWISLGRQSYPKELVIPLPQDREQARIRIIRVQDEEVVYDQVHLTSEGEVHVPVEGTGMVDFQIFVDDVVRFKTIDFTKKEDVS